MYEGIMNNLLIFPRSSCDFETLIICANIKVGYAFKIKVAYHYRFAGLGFGKSRMNASCTGFHAGETASNHHVTDSSFHVDLKYL